MKERLWVVTSATAKVYKGARLVFSTAARASDTNIKLGSLSPVAASRISVRTWPCRADDGGNGEPHD